MRKIAIVGASDLGQLILKNILDTKYSLVGFYDDFKPLGFLVEGYKVLGKLENISQDFSEGVFTHLVIGVGYKHMAFRAKLFEKLSVSIPFHNVIHPSIRIHESVKLGQGIVIFSNCTIDYNVCLGNNTLINTSANISHDSKIGDHSFIGPCVAIAGFVSIGEKCFIGINTTIIDNLTICDETQTGGGTVMIRSTTCPSLYVGNPARKVIR